MSAILKETEEKTRRQLKIRRSGKAIASIINEACREEQISPVELKNGGRSGAHEVGCLQKDIPDTTFPRCASSIFNNKY